VELALISELGGFYVAVVSWYLTKFYVSNDFCFLFCSPSLLMAKAIFWADWQQLLQRAYCKDTKSLLFDANN